MHRKTPKASDKSVSFLSINLFLSPFLLEIIVSHESRKNTHSNETEISSDARLIISITMRHARFVARVIYSSVFPYCLLLCYVMTQPWTIFGNVNDRAKSLHYYHVHAWIHSSDLLLNHRKSCKQNVALFCYYSVVSSLRDIIKILTRRIRRND